MNLDKAEEAYRNDPQFRQLIDILVQQIQLLEFSPSEIRQAAVFACIVQERRNPKPLLINMQSRPNEKDARSCKIEANP